MTVSRSRTRAVEIAFLLTVAGNAFGSSFLPVHARALHAVDPAGTPWLSADVAAGLPITAFWMAVAAAQLTTGIWERGRDHRILFVAGTAAAAAGLLMAGLSDGVLGLIAWRGVGGFGVGVAMMLTQDALIRGMGPAARTRASGLYVSLFFAGTIIGTLAGGELAARLGFAETLVAAAALSAVACALAVRLAPHREEESPQPLRFTVLLGNRPLMALVAFAAVPSRIVNAGVVFYLIPLHLHDAGTPSQTIGWIVAVYSFMLATTTTFWSRLADRTGRPLAFTVAGAALSAAAVLIIPLGGSGVAGAIAAVALLGIAQAIGMPPQVTVLFRVAAEEMERYGRTRLLGLYRVAERAGLFLGPMAAAALVSGHDYGPAFLALGLGMGAAGGALAAVFALHRRRRAACGSGRPA